MKRGVSVSSARSKPGSTPASSGNSCSSDRQNASMVLMPMSPNASRISRQRCARDAALAMPLPQRRHHALAHFRRGLAREGDREDVARRHARFEQAHVAIDEHARLAGAGRRFERDVAQRIDRQPPRPRVGGFLRLERRASNSNRGCSDIVDPCLLCPGESRRSRRCQSWCPRHVPPRRDAADRDERTHRAEVLGLRHGRVMAGARCRRAPRPADDRRTPSDRRTACRVLRAARPPAGLRTTDTSPRSR